MTEDEMNAQRAAVIAEARAWIGTPYHSNACIKGVGVDCATLIAACYIKAGARPPFEIGNYSAQWHLHNSRPLYEEAILQHGGKRIENPKPGDLALYKQAQTFSHGALIVSTSPLRIIHAYAPARSVIEGNESECGSLFDVERRFYTVW